MSRKTMPCLRHEHELGILDLINGPSRSGGTDERIFFAPHHQSWRHDPMQIATTIMRSSRRHSALDRRRRARPDRRPRSEEHTSELQSLMRISYAVFCLKKKTYINQQDTEPNTTSLSNNYE